MITNYYQHHQYAQPTRDNDYIHMMQQMWLAVNIRVNIPFD